MNAAEKDTMRRLLALVARGQAEGAYNTIVAGPDYATRIMQRANCLLTGSIVLGVTADGNTVRALPDGTLAA